MSDIDQTHGKNGVDAAEAVRSVSALLYVNGKNEGINIGNQQAIIRELNLMAATANELVNAGDTHGATILREFASKMLDRAMQRRDEETT